VQIPISARSSSASIAGAVAAALAGIVLIRLLVAYGAWYRARWAAWTGGILAVLSVSAPLVTFRTGSLEITDNPLTFALGWAIAAAGAAFMVGLVLVKREASRP